MEEATLKQIQKSIREADILRISNDISDEEREALELSVVALCDAERLVIANMGKQLYEEMANSLTEINNLSKEIRQRVTKMEKTAKSLSSIRNFLSIVVDLLTAIGKWR